jgi:hypothetical protein
VAQRVFRSHVIDRKSMQPHSRTRRDTANLYAVDWIARVLLEGSVHALDSSICARVVGLSKAVIDAGQKADPVKRADTKTCSRPRMVFRQTGELDAAMPLQTSMQRTTSQRGNSGLQCIEAILQRQQRVLAKKPR